MLRRLASQPSEKDIDRGKQKMHFRIKINPKARLVRLCNKLEKRGFYRKDLKGIYIARVVENKELYKSVLNKIMTTCEQCVK